jgi:hypothetical protein
MADPVLVASAVVQVHAVVRVHAESGVTAGCQQQLPVSVPFCLLKGRLQVLDGHHRDHDNFEC